MDKQFKPYNISILIIASIVAELLFWGVAIFIYYILSSVDGFRLENPKSLWLLVITPAILILWIVKFSLKNRSLARLSEGHLLSSITTKPSTNRASLKYFFLRFALGFIILALTNPQYGEKKKEGIAQGIELMIALDVSNSMLARDLSDTRSRLNIAKRAIERLLTKLRNDKIGIVVFAGSAYTQLPITSDYNAAKLFLNGVTTGILSSQGTAIGAAIDECLNAFDLENGTNKAIVIISDGENHEDGATGSAQVAEDNGIQIHTIGMGTPKGTPIEIYNGDRKVGVKKDKDGNTVITKLNEQMLQELAEIGNGTYTRANKANVGLDNLIEELKKIDKTVLDKAEFQHYEDHFQLYLLIGLLFAFGYILTPVSFDSSYELNLFKE